MCNWSEKAKVKEFNEDKFWTESPDSSWRGKPALGSYIVEVFFIQSPGSSWRDKPALGGYYGVDIKYKENL